jgi:type IV secretion system protein VirB11
MRSEAESYLDLYLRPLASYFRRQDVTDIYVNQSGEFWIETLGGTLERREDPALDQEHLWRLARQIASQSSQSVSRSNPLLAATLPDGSRVQIVAPPAVRQDMAMAIRRHTAVTVDLAAYRRPSGSAAEVATGPAEVRRLSADQDYPTFLSWAVRARRNVLISGGTSSGKTTLLNSLLREIPNTERLIFIEDTPELQLIHPNSVGLVAARGGESEANVAAEDLLQAALRMRPDRIVLGELRGPEAFTFLRAINTGHPGSLSTIHADSAERAYVQLAMMVIQAGVNLPYQDALGLVREMVDVVVQLARNGAERYISEVIVRS